MALYFPTFIIAQTLGFYWIALIIVHSHMYFMSEKLAGLVALVNTEKEYISYAGGDTDNNDSATPNDVSPPFCDRFVVVPGPENGMASNAGAQYLSIR